MKRFVYADNAATTKISPAVLDAMMPWLTDGYGNASSIYQKGREARLAMEKARHQVEKALGVPLSRPRRWKKRGSRSPICRSATRG